MTVLAHTFNIMLPDKATLYAEMICDREKLYKIYRVREIADIEAEHDRKQGSESPLPGPSLIINPSEETIKEYLKNPTPTEDYRMTQIDLLKSNSIEIFYNLLMLQNNVNNQNMRSFLCSEF